MVIGRTPCDFVSRSLFRPCSFMGLRLRVFAAMRRLEFSRGFMVFEYIVQPPSSRPRQRRMILARLFKAGTISASVPVAAATVDFADRCQPSLPRLKPLCDCSPGFEKPG